jgi:hypothetical protein
VRLELTAADTQDLAQTLLWWLAENGHELPELPAVEADLGLVAEDEDEEPNPYAADGVPAVLPAQHSRPLVSVPDRFGELQVRTENWPAGPRMVIEKADPWVLASTELLEELRAGSPWATVDGLHIELRDSAGTTCRYLARPDVDSEAGTVVLQRLHDPVTVAATFSTPEHTRGG